MGNQSMRQPRMLTLTNSPARDAGPVVSGAILNCCAGEVRHVPQPWPCCSEVPERFTLVAFLLHWHA